MKYEVTICAVGVVQTKELEKVPNVASCADLVALDGNCGDWFTFDSSNPRIGDCVCVVIEEDCSNKIHTSEGVDLYMIAPATSVTTRKIYSVARGSYFL